jgi:hypothetical protein
MKRILVMLLTVMTAGLLAAPPAGARAGGWAETVLDAPPARIEAGVTYTFGYWVLQHGSYPMQSGSDQPTGLRATDENGAEALFPGTKSATDGHYSAEVVFPHDGTWTIGSTLAQLMPDEDVATVTVPGEVKISPSDVAQRAPYEWGAVRPSFPPTADDASIGAPMGYLTTTPQPEVAPRSNAVADEPGSDLPLWVVFLAGAATLGLAGWLMLRHRRTNSR